jgi:hypothetical protein
MWFSGGVSTRFQLSVIRMGGADVQASIAEWSFKNSGSEGEGINGLRSKDSILAPILG